MARLACSGAPLQASECAACTRGALSSIPLKRRAIGIDEFREAQNTVSMATLVIDSEERVGTVACVSRRVGDAVDEINMSVAEGDIASPATGIGVAGQGISARDAILRTAIGKDGK